MKQFPKVFSYEGAGPVHAIPEARLIAMGEIVALLHRVVLVSPRSAIRKLPNRNH